MNYLSILTIIYFTFLPLVSLAGYSTDQNYYINSIASRSSGTGVALIRDNTGKIKSDHIELYFNSPQATTFQINSNNLIQAISDSPVLIDPITTLYIDYDFTITSGNNCRIILSHGLYSWASTPQWNFSTTTTTSISRRTDSANVSSRSGNVYLGAVLGLGGNSANTCVGTMKIYDIYDDLGTHHLTFAQGGGNSTLQSIPIPYNDLMFNNLQLSTTTCANTTTSTVCSLQYQNSTSTALEDTNNIMFTLMVVVALIAIIMLSNQLIKNYRGL